MATRSGYCDGIRRRDLLRVGTAGLLGAGLSLSELLQYQALAKEVTSDRPARDVSLIILFLKGGLSTIDVWDLKPQAAAEFRGPYQPIDTIIPGIRIGEHLPLTAGQMDKFSLIRSFGHRNSDHGPADHYMLTGYHPLPGFNGNLKPNNQRPAYGAVVARKLGPRGSVPPYVCLPRVNPSTGAAYLGASAAPFAVESDPNTPNFAVPDLMPPLAVPGDRLSSRQGLLTRIDRFRQSGEIAANQSAQVVNTFQQKAFDLMTSSATKSAFDIQQESPQLREQYGRTSLGQSCLMARRLVEAGVRCVTIDHNNWDTHHNCFPVLKDEMLPMLDRGLAALFRDLADRGLLETTMVVVTGEFGRTPRINEFAGRDHWGPSFTVALGGGGIQGGRVVGRSDSRGEKPETPVIGPEDLSATMFSLMGINPEDEFYTPEGRPVKIANNGKVIRELL
jgi:hypothetical protein